MKYLILLVVLSGCTYESTLDKSELDKSVTCTDTRDGEVFTFLTNNVTNVTSSTSNGASFDVVTTEGKSMHITSAAEAWLKCTKEKVNK